MADKKSLSDLADLTNPKPEAPAAEAPAEAAPPAPASEAPAEVAAERRPGSGRSGNRRDRDEAPNDHGVSTQGPQIEAVLREQQLDKQGRAYATGRRSLGGNLGGGAFGRSLGSRRDFGFRVGQLTEVGKGFLGHYAPTLFLRFIAATSRTLGS